MYILYFLLLMVVGWGCLISNRGYVMIMGILCAAVLVLVPFQGDVVYLNKFQGSDTLTGTTQTINGTKLVTTNVNEITTYNHNNTVVLMHFTTFEYKTLVYLNLLLLILLVFRWYALNYEWGTKARLS